MNCLIPHIEYLLQYNDCVIVPGLGAILAHNMAPRYDEEEQMWHAPARVFSFNPALSRTDGMLASSIARREGISYDSATSIVRKEVEKMLASLDEKHELSLCNAGTLYMDEEGLLSYTPGTAQWLSPDFMWLPQVNLGLQRRVSEIMESHARINRRNKLSSILLRCGQAAACIAVMITLGWIVVQNLTYAPEEQFASIVPNVVANNHTANVAAGNNPVVLVLAKAPEGEVIENIPAPKVVKEEKNNSARYYLIVASLASENEAKKFLKQHTDSNLGIFEKDGRYRIYAASGNTIESVSSIQKTEDFASRYPNAWICRK